MFGTGRFLGEMMPRGAGITSEGAKALMLKDTDYSTPTDHYFSHLQRLKTENIEDSVRADLVLDSLDIDKNELDKIEK